MHSGQPAYGDSGMIEGVQEDDDEDDDEDAPFDDYFDDYLDLLWEHEHMKQREQDEEQENHRERDPDSLYQEGHEQEGKDQDSHAQKSFKVKDQDQGQHKDQDQAEDQDQNQKIDQDGKQKDGERGLQSVDTADRHVFIPKSPDHRPAAVGEPKPSFFEIKGAFFDTREKTVVAFEEISTGFDWSNQEHISKLNEWRIRVNANAMNFIARKTGKGPTLAWFQKENDWIELYLGMNLATQKNKRLCMPSMKEATDEYNLFRKSLGLPERDLPAWETRKKIISRIMGLAGKRLFHRSGRQPIRKGIIFNPHITHEMLQSFQKKKKDIVGESEQGSIHRLKPRSDKVQNAMSKVYGEFLEEEPERQAERESANKRELWCCECSRGKHPIYRSSLSPEKNIVGEDGDHKIDKFKAGSPKLQKDMEEVYRLVA